MAEQERKMISERIKAALAIRRRQGQVLGFALRSKRLQRQMRARARAALRKAALERAEAYRVHIEWALRQPGAYGIGRPISFRGAANQLNARHLPSPGGGRWESYRLRQMVQRLRIAHPPGHVPGAIAQARIEALWKRHPHYSAKHIIAHLAPRFPLGLPRVERVLKHCRAAAAKRSALYQQVGWPLDRRTVARIRIGALWKKHPALTAQQVIQTLRPGPFLTVHYVQQVMRECWRACGRHTPDQWQIGRRGSHTRRRRSSQHRS